MTAQGGNFFEEIPRVSLVHLVSPAWCLQRSRQHSRSSESVAPMPGVEGDACSRRTRGLGYSRCALVYRQPPGTTRIHVHRPYHAFSRRNMSLRTRRHVPRLANDVKIAAKRCAPRRAAGPRVARMVFATIRRSARWLTRIRSTRGRKGGKRTLVGEHSRQNGIALHYCSITKYKNERWNLNSKP